jgi:hypothetical protein
MAAAKPDTNNRFEAAVAAVLAAAGSGHDARELDSPERTRLRQQGLDWLRSLLTAWEKRLDGAKTPADRLAVQRTLRTWQQHVNLATVREEKEMAKLAAAEQEAWRQFWADVAALLERATAG